MHARVCMCVSYMYIWAVKNNNTEAYLNCYLYSSVASLLISFNDSWTTDKHDWCWLMYTTWSFFLCNVPSTSTHFLLLSSTLMQCWQYDTVVVAYCFWILRMVTVFMSLVWGVNCAVCSGCKRRACAGVTIGMRGMELGNWWERQGFEEVAGGINGCQTD